MKNNRLIKKLTVSIILIISIMQGVGVNASEVYYPREIQIIRDNLASNPYASVHGVLQLQSNGNLEVYVYDGNYNMLSPRKLVIGNVKSVYKDNDSLYENSDGNAFHLSTETIKILLQDGTIWKFSNVRLRHKGSDRYEIDYRLYPISLGNNSGNSITSIMYLPNSAPIPTGFSHKGGDVYERVSAGYTILFYLIRYNPPTTIGNLNIQ